MEEGPPKSVMWTQASNQAVVLKFKSLGIERLLKPKQDFGEVCVIEMNENEPLLSSVETEPT